jgi:hypothetical protein
MQTGSGFPLINSHNNWGKLEEVWLGDVYPASWYDHLESEVRDCFQEITERTQQDLQVIEHKLNEFDVIVRRPQYDQIDDYVTARGPYGVTSACGTEQLIKPEITPRDYYITVNNTLFATSQWANKKSPWQHIIDEYKQQGGDVQHSIQKPGRAIVTGANTVRAGRDIYLDLAKINTGQLDLQSYFNQVQLSANNAQKFLKEFLPENRIHILNNGGHLDGCFALLKPGVLLATNYFDSYEKTFPGWARIETKSPEFSKHYYKQPPSGSILNGTWWLPGMKPSRAFNEHLIKHAQTWIGDYTETFFEVNCLVIDEKNVIVLGEHDAIFRRMEEYGITAHSIPFRTRTFWDGGMHCLTLDIRRQTKLEDFFPERGDGPGMILIDDPSVSNPMMTRAAKKLQKRNPVLSNKYIY